MSLEDLKNLDEQIRLKRVELRKSESDLRILEVKRSKLRNDLSLEEKEEYRQHLRDRLGLSWDVGETLP